MTNKYGNIRRVKKINSGTTDESAFFKKRGAMYGAAITPAITVRAVVKLTTVNTAFKKACTSVFVSPRRESSRYDLNVGMNATDMLFSANRRRNRLGIIKATPNASASAEVPKNAAFVISRTRPSMRDTKVNSDSFIPEESNDRFIATAYRYCLFMTIPVEY